MLAAVVRHLVSDQVGFPVEGLGTLVALVFPLLGVGQGVRLQTAADAQTTRHLGHMSVCQVNLLRRVSLSAFTHLWTSGNTWSHSLHSWRPWDMWRGRRSWGSWALRSPSPPGHKIKTEKCCCELHKVTQLAGFLDSDLSYFLIYLHAFLASVKKGCAPLGRTWVEEGGRQHPTRLLLVVQQLAAGLKVLVAVFTAVLSLLCRDKHRRKNPFKRGV